MRRTLLVAFVLAACTPARPEPQPPITREPVTPTPTASTSAAPSASAHAPLASATAASCARDDDCEYDDPCDAKSCVRAVGKSRVGCGESSPPPLVCACVGGACTMRRRGPPRGTPATGCKSSEDCAFDETTGVCGAGAGTDVVDEGIFCACVDRGCMPGIARRVPCSTSEDCSLEFNPYHPVSSSKVPRPAGKPCWNYTHTSECHDGRCKIVDLKC